MAAVRTACTSAKYDHPPFHQFQLAHMRLTYIFPKSLTKQSALSLPKTDQLSQSQTQQLPRSAPSAQRHRDISPACYTQAQTDSRLVTNKHAFINASACLRKPRNCDLP
jgi:hypothetical protein